MNLGLDAVRRPSVLIVDDTPDNLVLMSDLLKDRYLIKARFTTCATGNLGRNQAFSAVADGWGAALPIALA